MKIGRFFKVLFAACLFMFLFSCGSWSIGSRNDNELSDNDINGETDTDQNKKEFIITSISPSEALPGQTVKIEGKGFDFVNNDEKLLINGNPFPILMAGTGFVKIYVPPFEKGSYEISIEKSDGERSNSLTLKINQMPLYGKYPGEIAEKVKDRLSSLTDGINITFEAMIKEGVIPEESSEKFTKEINTFLLFSENILKYKKNLTEAEKTMLDGMLYNSGIYDMLSNSSENLLLKSTVNACLNSPLSCFYIMCDQISFFASLIAGISSRLALVSGGVAIVSGGTLAPAALGTAVVLSEISLYAGLLTHPINVLIPSDLHKIDIKNELGEKITSIELLEGDEMLFEIHGLFEPQETISEATYDIVLTGMMEELFPNSKKKAGELICNELIPIINDVFSKCGINPADKIVSDILDPVDNLLWKESYQKVDMRIFSKTSTESLFESYLGTFGISIGAIIDFLNDNGVDIEEYDAVKTESPETASIIFKNNKSYVSAKKKGRTPIVLKGVRFDDKDLPWQIILFVGSDWYKYVEYSINVNVVDQESCVPKCSGKECGDNGCGGVCGTCEEGKYCSAKSKCVCNCDNIDCLNAYYFGQSVEGIGDGWGPDPTDECYTGIDVNVTGVSYDQVGFSEGKCQYNIKAAFSVTNSKGCCFMMVAMGNKEDLGRGGYIVWHGTESGSFEAAVPYYMTEETQQDFSFKYYIWSYSDDMSATSKSSSGFVHDDILKLQCVAN